MRRTIAGDIELDDDPARVDVAELHRFLVEASYWVRERSVQVDRFTADAHDFYGRFGFGPCPPHALLRSRRGPGPDDPSPGPIVSV